MKDLCIRENYKGKDGTDKTSWNKIGILFTSNDKEYMKLFHMPGILINVFEQKAKEDSGEVF